MRKKDFVITGLPDTLFPLNFDALKEQRCPKCGNKLYQTYDRKLWICRAKKKHKPFIITDKKMKEYKKSPPA